MKGTAPLRILGETAYPLTVASARVRVASFEEFLRPHGVELGYSPTLADHEYALLASKASAVKKAVVLARSASRTAGRSAAYDLLLIHRLRSLTPLPGFDPPRHLDLYDIDDALFISSAATVNARFQWAKQEVRRCIAYLRRARLVIAGNPFLAAKARQYARCVEIVPSCVDPDRQTLRTHQPREVIRVGWIGSHTTSAYLQPVLPVFEQLNKHELRAKLVLVGAEPSLRASWIEHLPWSLASAANDLASFDVGIMPLPDTDWARGKCGYKILQYFSAGIPAIASPVGISSELIGHERGLLASSPDEWYAALNELALDVARRRETGAAARTFVERNYSYRRWAPELAAIMRSVAG